MAEQAGLWLRVSSKGQSEENQVPEVTGWTTAHEYEVARTYRLHGRSAYKGEQAAMLAEMLDDMRHGRISVLVVWKVDRIERRGPRFAFDLMYEVQQAGGRIEFVTETYLNEMNAAGEMMLSNMSIMAREESKTKSDRVRSGRDAARANGAATGQAPWGFGITGPKRAKAFVPSALGRREVPGIFDRVAAGESLTSIALDLTARRVGDRRWYASTVGMLVRNPTYKGTTVNGQGIVVHRHEGLVDASQWKRANDAANAPGKKRRGPGQAKSMLTGVARCGECGGPMYRTAAEKGRQTRYYRCSNSHGMSVATGRVEAAVDGVMRQALRKVKVTREVLVPGQSWDAEIEAVKFELRHLDPDALDYDERHAKLREALAEFKARPSVLDQWETVVTDRTYGDEWAEQAEHERAKWLKGHGFTVWIRRDAVKVSRDDFYGEDLGDLDLWPSRDSVIHSGRMGVTVPIC